MSREEKLDILRRVDKVAREADKRVQEVTASLSGVYELILGAATDGTLAADVRPLVRLSVSVLVEEDGKRERGASGGGGRFGYEFFLAHSPLYTSVDPLQSMSREEKLDILRRVDKVAREADKRVQEVTASLSGVY